MNVKKVYFVRHGESEGNAGPIRQGHNSELTQKGLEQSGVIAERCERLSIDSVISSTMKRAVETTEIILTRLKKPTEYSDLFVERRRPKEQIGTLKNDPKALEAEKTIRENFTVSRFRFSDEENFDDLKMRAGQALRYLQQKPEKNILVVTHGFFLRIIVAYIVFGEKLTAWECEQFIQKFHTENTGMTVLEFDEKNKTSPWWLWVWNDHAHLC